VAVADTHASTEAAHGEGGGGLPQFEFQHWFGQIVYLIFLFAVLYWLMAKVFVPRLRGVIDQRAATIADAVQTARQVQAEAAGQAAAAKAEVEAARASSRATAAAAKARVTDAANARAAEEEAVVNARIAEAETAIGKTRDAAMTNVASIASDTAAAIVERLTGKAPTAAEAAAAVKGAA
jgi:F-type H+-transporting ATPase subunit b